MDEDISKYKRRIQELELENSILQKKLDSQTLNTEKLKFSTLIEQIGDGISLADQTGDYVLTNPAFCRMTGYSEPELLSMNVHDMLSPEVEMELFPQVLANKSGHREVMLRKKDGSHFIAEVRGFPIQLDGQLHVLGIIRDVTERKKTEEALKESEQKYTILFDNLLDEVHVWKILKDQTGKITGWSLLDANLPALKAWGKVKEAVIGKTANEIFGYDAYSDFLPIVEKIFETGEPYRWERYFEGANQYLSMDSIPLGSYFISTGRDISHLKKTEHALKESNTTKDKFFSIIAHDLRSPFTNLLGFTELIKDNPESFEYATFSKIAETMNSTAKDTLTLLDNLLNWARSQTEQIKVVPEKQVLHPIVEELFKLFQVTAQKKKILLKYSESEEITVFADPNMIKTVLRNLISNAIKFTGASGRIDVRASQDEAYTEIAVADTGVGIDEAAQKNLFRLEANHSTRGTANEKGTGLGLILCKDFVEKHGGRIWVESQVGKGTTFKIRLPKK